MSSITRRSTTALLLFIVCFFVVWSIRAICLYAIDESLAPGAPRTVYSLAVKLLLWGVPAFGYARWVRRQSPFRYLGLAILPSARQWLKYLIVIALFLAAQIGFEILVGGRRLALSTVQAALTLCRISKIMRLRGLKRPFVSKIMRLGLTDNETGLHSSQR